MWAMSEKIHTMEQLEGLLEIHAAGEQLLEAFFPRICA